MKNWLNKVLTIVVVLLAQHVFVLTRARRGCLSHIHDTEVLYSQNSVEGGTPAECHQFIRCTYVYVKQGTIPPLFLGYNIE